MTIQRVCVAVGYHSLDEVVECSGGTLTKCARNAVDLCNSGPIKTRLNHAPSLIYRLVRQEQ
jgi:hypothetical protein